ncbi:MAG: electron transfer flavoprotein subunit alpha/FixB family protein [Saprospiraceae bacterium]|nr:electron transfer flavoprotein subunit alpha/FixB family protein [Saprospiraceae bacterium]
MSVLVFAEAINNKYKKSSLEVVNYGAKLASSQGSNVIVLTNASADAAAELGKYGAQKVLNFESDSLHDNKMLSQIISDVANSHNADTVILSDNSKGKSLAGRIAIKLDAAAVSSATTLPNLEDGFVVQKSLFSGKAIGHYQMKASKKVITVAGNSIGLEEMGQPVAAEAFDASAYNATVEMVETKRVEGTVPLPEAELVVSAGRGMKGPENWGIIEDLAKTLGATTACSRPVADTGWRPHHEHVGQTGIAIKPNLYIAIGISGAIQHLAGVNHSKTIVVINKDPEAPFFKAADYGIVADLFDVVPRLTEALQKFKAS